MANIRLPNPRRARTVGAGSDELVAADQNLTATAAAELAGPVADLAFGPLGDALVATHYGRDAVSLVHPAGLTPEVVVPLSGDPFLTTVTQDHAYVATTSLRNEDTVEVVDLSTNTVVAGYEMVGTISALAASEDGKRVFAARTREHRADIAVIDTTTDQVSTIDTGWGPAVNIDALHVGDNGHRLYAAVSDARSSHLVVVNVETGRVDGAIGIGAPIRDVVIGPEQTAYVLTSDRLRGGSVAVVDLYGGRIRHRIDLGGAPTQLVLNADGTRAFIVDHDSVMVLCTVTNEVLDVIDVDTAPSCVALSPEGSRLVVADYAGGLTAFEVAANVPLLYSQFLATDPIPAADGRRLPAEVA